jgi:hypothetical protein
MEKLPACSVAAGRPILTQTIILDMSGLSPLKHFTLTVQKFLHTLSQVDQVRGGGREVDQVDQVGGGGGRWTRWTRWEGGEGGGPGGPGEGGGEEEGGPGEGGGGGTSAAGRAGSRAVQNIARLRPLLFAMSSLISRVACLDHPVEATMPLVICTRLKQGLQAGGVAACNAAAVPAVPLHPAEQIP